MTVHVQSPTFTVQWPFFAIITVITIDNKYKTNNQVMEQPTTNLCIFIQYRINITDKKQVNNFIDI